MGLNVWIVEGRTTKDVLVTAGEKKVAKVTLAVARGYQNTDSDYINVTAFDKVADILEKVQKGQQIVVQGTGRTGSYTNKDGQKVYTTELYANKIVYGLLPRDSSAPQQYAAQVAPQNQQPAYQQPAYQQPTPPNQQPAYQQPSPAPAQAPAPNDGFTDIPDQMDGQLPWR